MLRKWQLNCVQAALNKFSKERSHFFCQATPGAGKTVMAAELAKRLLELDEIDLVLCFSPSLTVSEGIKKTFSCKLDCSFNGGLGSLGASYTYQSIRYMDDDFWNTIQKYRVFAVFDEVHHCSYDDQGRANVWGDQVINKIQSLAKYTLALSGTPWRSDSIPIAMAEYTDPEGQLVCDYQYGLKQAVAELVCRSPKVALIDNEHLSLKEGNQQQSFSSILELIRKSDVSYQSVIHNDKAMSYLLELGCRKLEKIRKQSPSAGGLVVASSVKHAKCIQTMLIQEFAQSACIVTYHHDSPLEEIDAFRHGDTQWIVSVGMISEGTDIPRLQVCCHMSAVKTELYFRQVLGRILRMNDSPNQEAWLFTFAEENLIGFAERIEQDIPDTCMYVTRELSKQSFVNHASDFSQCKKEKRPSDEQVSCHIEWQGNSIEPSIGSVESWLVADELRLGLFNQRVISAFT